MPPAKASSSAASFLALSKATFRLGDRLIFQNTSWHFSRGQHWAILGPNGAGKSLFADCLRGRLPLVSGELTWHFRPPQGMAPEEAIAYVSFDERRKALGETVVQSRWNSLELESTASVDHYLSLEQVLDINPFEVRPLENATEAQFARARARAERLFALQPLLDRMLLSLSNGERQRVELARALCRPVRLLILDEPFAGLDSSARQHLSQILERLMRTSVRLMLITTRPEDLPPGMTHHLWVSDCRISSARAHLPLSNSGSPAPSVNLKQPASVSDDSIPKGSQRGKPPLIELRDVSVRYGKRRILHHLNWTVRQHESWALLGPNGCGKTTLLSLISGDNPQAYSNHIRVFGRLRGEGESVWELKQHLGWLSPELHTHFDLQLSCLAAVESGFFESNGLFELPSAHQRRRAKVWLNQLGLGHLAGHQLFEISTGLQRMVLLGRALVKNPRLLLLDEPCQGLDADHRALLIRTVDHLIRTKATTVIYVTHRRDEIPPSIHKVLRLSVQA